MAATTMRKAITSTAPKDDLQAKRSRSVRAGRLVIPLLLLAFAGPGHARAQEIQTLFGGRVSHGGAGGPVVRFSDIGGDLGVWVGGRGGWIISFEGDHSISIGGGGYGLATSHAVPDPAAAGWPGADDLRARAGYGGFELEYTNRSYRLVHWSASTLVGAGSLAIERGTGPVTGDEPSFFVFEPGLHAGLNVTSFMRLNAGVSYRHTRGIDRAGFTDRDFSGVNGSITLRFGRFP